MPETPDSRMAWIRNLERLPEECCDEDFLELEIGSDAYVPGVLNYSDGAILCGPIAMEKSRSGLFLYDLRLALPRPQDAGQVPRGTRKGYAFRAGVAGELLALFSVFLHCRFYLVSESHGGLTSTGLRWRREHPYIHRPCDADIDPVLFGGHDRNFAQGLDTFLDQVRRLPPQYHQRFILSCHHFGRALREVGVDTEMVFIRLVSAIEALCRDTPLPRRDDPFYGVPFDEFVRTERLTAGQVDELRKVFETRKAWLRFRTFVLDHCGGFFRGGNFGAKRSRITKADLPDVLKAVYDARSDYLHSGEAMYLSTVFRPHSAKWHLDPTIGMHVDRRWYDPKRKLPYTHFFHSLVRHCLLQFLDRRSPPA